MTNPYLVSVDRFIAAPPTEIFEVLAAPSQHSMFDGSGTVRGALPDGPARLSLGAEFGMDMVIVVKYRILNTVCEFEEGSRIGWRHFFGHVWRYILTPAADSEGKPGTLVTEQWDASAVRGRLLLRLAGFPRRHPDNIEQSLQLLDRYVTGQRPGTPQANSGKVSTLINTTDGRQNVSGNENEPVEISTRMRPGEWSEDTLQALVADYQEKIREMGADQADVVTHIDRDDHGGVSLKVTWNKDQVIEDPLA